LYELGAQTLEVIAALGRTGMTLLQAWRTSPGWHSSSSAASAV
jgi:hypothetical protein